MLGGRGDEGGWMHLHTLSRYEEDVVDHVEVADLDQRDAQWHTEKRNGYII
jgi:hypothetical protein